MRWRSLFLVTVVAALAATTAPSWAQVTAEDVGEIRGLRLGMRAADMLTEAFGEYFCGANGGAPRQRIAEWEEYKKCRPEASGLHEVVVRFDDKNEAYARAIDDEILLKRLSGTRVGGLQVILSVLFDEPGVARGIRMVTDPRAPIFERRMGHMLRFRVFQRYEPDGWNCVDEPAAEGETPVGGFFVKVQCEKKTPERNMWLQSRLLRKPGQTDYDPVNQEVIPGYFESSTKFEMFDPAYKKG